MKQYIVDAFTDTLFTGNQAAVCVLKEWISDSLMQNIAKENRFSETAFTVKNDDGTYALRWFTPGGEIDFCGHATLGASFVLFNYYETGTDSIDFRTKVGKMTVERVNESFVMDFPAYHCNQIPVTAEMSDAIGAKVLEAYLDRDLMLVLKDEETLISLKPDQNKLKELEGLCVAVTTRGNEYDCVSRVFAPKMNVEEDPVTGSTHCMITPYWCHRLGKDRLKCFQASERTGILYTCLSGDRVKISGKAVLYSEGEILPEKSFVLFRRIL